MIAVQLGISHWFYLYIVWFFPMVVLALFGSFPERALAASVAPAEPVSESPPAGAGALPLASAG
jgi:hypothetical protein